MAPPRPLAASDDLQEPSWGDLQILLAICRAGSLSGAGRALGYDHSTVFRRINAIESKSGVRFFERMPRGYVMTAAGEAVKRHAERIEREVQALGREVLGQDTRLKGKIRVTAPEGIATDIAPIIVSQFCRDNPEISVEVLASNTELDLSNREAEVALRATSKPPDSSLGRKICDFGFAIYSTRDYLGSRPGIGLSNQDWCFFHGRERWLVPLVWERLEDAEARARFTSPSTRSVLNAVGQGLGVAMLPCYVGDSDKRLVRVSAPLAPRKLELWILTHPDLRHTARVRALMKFLFLALRKDQELFAGNRPQGPSGGDIVPSADSAEAIP